MVYVLFLLALLLVGNYKYYAVGVYPGDLGKEQSQIIKGIFIALVFCGHSGQYVKFNAPLDYPFLKFYWYIGQFVVAMFLLYSGYGIMVSIMKKGRNYVRGLPVKRILKTLLHFDLAVLLYMGISVWRHGWPSLKDTLLALSGWGGFGNSNWYIFAILWIWVIVYFVFRLCGTEHARRNVWFCTLLTALFGFIISHYKQMWWYDTLLCFPLGMIVAVYRDEIELFLFQIKQVPILGKCEKYGGTFLLFILAVVILGRHKGNFYLYETWMIALTVSVFLLTMKFEFHSRILLWLGKNLFEVYILMRIPMILFQPYMVGHNYWYFLLCAVCTYLLVIAFSYVVRQIDKSVFA